MDFIDSVLVRLADPAERTALFTADAMAAIATAAYDMDAMVVQPPFNPVFDQFEIGTFVAPAAVFDGFWNPQGAAQRTEVRVRAEGLAPASVVRVDAVWRGSIIARTVPMDSHITSVNMSWASLDIDAQIVADLGALPTDPGVLESERRARLLAQIHAGLDQPAAFSDEYLGAWLMSAGATTVGDLLARYQQVEQPGGLTVSFSPPSATPPAPKALPFSGAILIRKEGFSLAQLLMESKLVRDQLQGLGFEAPPASGVKRRNPVVIVWIVRGDTFDDDGWPGGNDTMTAAQKNHARRLRAAEWLAREGIGLATAT
jgi:hypothetical protein